MVLALGYVLGRVATGVAEGGVGGWRGRISGSPILVVWLGVAVIFFIYFYPVWTGVPIGDQQYLGGFGTGRMWFLKWI